MKYRNKGKEEGTQQVRVRNFSYWCKPVPVQEEDGRLFAFASDVWGGQRDDGTWFGLVKPSQEFWNALVKGMDLAFGVSYAPHPTRPSKTERKIDWTEAAKEWESGEYGKLVRQGTPLYHIGREFNLPQTQVNGILRSFRTAIDEAFKRKRRGLPAKKTDLDSFVLYTTDCSTGWSVDWLFRQNAPNSPVNLHVAANLDDFEGMNLSKTASREIEQNHQGHFQIGNGKIDFLLKYHRPLPVGSKIRQVQFIARKEKSLRVRGNAPEDAWKCAVVFTTNETIEEKKSMSALKAMRNGSLDMGWRWHSHGQRTLMISDGVKNYEFFLPHDMSNHKEKRSLFGVIGNQKGMDYCKKKKAKVERRSLFAIEEMQRVKDDATLQVIELVKAESFTGLPEHVYSNGVFYQSTHFGIKAIEVEKMSHEGELRTVYYLLQEAGITYDWLTQWESANRDAKIRIRNIQIKREQKRDYLQRLIATFLTEQCGAIVIEKLELDKLQTKAQRQKSLSLKKAAKRQAFACLHQQVQFLKEAARKNDAKLIEIPPAFTSSVCRCGQSWHPEANEQGLFFECKDGHRLDRDSLACDNIAEVGGIDWEDAVPLDLSEVRPGGRFAQLASILKVHEREPQVTATRASFRAAANERKQDRYQVGLF